jgi:hypothetical protein
LELACLLGTSTKGVQAVCLALWEVPTTDLRIIHQDFVFEYGYCILYFILQFDLVIANFYFVLLSSSDIS